MADYDIGKAFGEIEDELIDSMIRNLKRHQVEEVAEGFEWSQWQALQLQALEDYKRKAAQKFGSKFSTINDRIEEMLTDTYNTAETSQEQKILKAIQKGLPEKVTPLTASGAIQGEFFKTNDRKLDALVKATTNDMERAEHAVLRMTDDKYRKIIFNAQVYANTGAGTYEKAVDMATKDFLSAGINCIEYRNGRRVNIRSYSEMAIRTANKRAYLQGEGEMRKKWGIHTVIMNKRSNPCPKCAPFVGKVIVDDVWSGGTADEAKEKGYLLMSDCIKQGLYHPNCQDSHTTYFGDILDGEDEEDDEEDDEEEDNNITPDEQKLNERLYDAEQRQNYCERQVQRFERMSNYSLDEDNQRIYRARKSEWKEKLAKIKNAIKEQKQKLNNTFKASESSKAKVLNPLSVVDRNMINSSDYRKHIDKLGEDTKTSREIYHRIKETLLHRTGTDFEDLIFINPITGETLVRNDYNVPRQCIPSRAMRAMVTANPNTIISIHNHPNSSVPSLDDINSAWKKKYKYGIIACHNGNLYKYKILGDYDPDYVDMNLDKVNRIIYNKDELGGQFEFKLSQALSELKANNVEMEVFLWK